MDRTHAAGDLVAGDEEYLNLAVTRLLPEFYQVTPDAKSGQTLRSLAKRLADSHGDRWLADALQTPHTEQAAQAFRDLAAAVAGNVRTDSIAASADARAAADLFRKAGNQAGAARAQFELVYALRVARSYDACGALAEPLAHEAEQHQYRWIVSAVLLEAGACREPSGDFAGAATDWRAAVAASDASHYPVQWLRATGFDAVRLRHVGDLTGAWRQQSRGLDVYWSGNYPLPRAQQFYADLSLLADSTGMPNSAVYMAVENERVTGLLNNTERHAAALQLLAMAEIAAGLPDRARRHHEEAVRLVADLSPERRAAFEVNTEIDMAEREASIGQVDQPIARLQRIASKLSYTGALYELRFNSLLGRLYVRRRDFAGARPPLAKALAIADAHRAGISEAERPLWVRGMTDAYRALVECEVQLGGGAQTALILWESYRRALFDPKKSGPATQSIPPGQAVLSFVELPSGMAAWLRTSDKHLFRKLDVPAAALRETIGRLVRGCSTDRSPVAALSADGRQLSQWLLGPWEQELEGVHALAIETDDAVAAVPWPALVLSKDRYWIDRFLISVRAAPGPADVSFAPTGPLEPGLVVGAPAAGEDLGLPPIPEAKIEAKKVCGRFPRSNLLDGQKATLSSVRAQLPSARFFHFAGHGFAGDGGGLILAGESGKSAMLQAGEIGNLDLSRCLLAVLSGCSTGSGELSGAGDPHSLVRAFLRAGTHEVVASYWELNSAGTSAFMQEFYGALAQGRPVAQSLQQAAAALRSGGMYAHPYYWAGIEVFE